MTNNAQATRGTADNLTIPNTKAHGPLPTPEKTDDTSESQPASSNPISLSNNIVEFQYNFASFVHQYIRDYIKLADQKATFFSTGATALLAFLYNKGVSVHWLKPVMTWNLLDIMAFVAMLFLSLGVLFSIFVVIPRTAGSKRGFLFWEAIAEYETGRQYADELSVLTPSSLFQIKADHCYDLAKVCRRKYKCLRWSLFLLAFGLFAALGVFMFIPK